MGHVTRPHGIRGEVVVHPLTDHPESAFAPGVVLLLSGAEGRPDPAAPPLRVDAARPTHRGWLVAFGGARERADAERLQGRDLLRRLVEVEPLADDEVFYHQLLGMEVVTVAGASLGAVTEVYELRPADLLEVTGPRGVHLIPFRREIVTGVDIDGRRLTIDPPAGLLELGLP